jgi:hypothetical protein
MGEALCDTMNKLYLLNSEDFGKHAAILQEWDKLNE